jgi:hypothetical protein
MSTVIDAARAALAAEHAAVYGYGVVGGRVAIGRRAEALQCLQAHQARRDALRRTVADLGGAPVNAAAAYELPFAVRDPEAAERFAVFLEERVAGAYGDVVRLAIGGIRRDAAAAMRDAAVRAVRWRGASTPFPGLAERT